MTPVRVQGVDPLIFGDGRPFSAEPGAQAVGGLKEPLPGTFAGAFRTAIGRRRGYASRENWTQAFDIEVRGPLLTIDDRLTVATPSNFAMMARKLAGRESEPVFLCARPVDPRSLKWGCDLPEGLWPTTLGDTSDLSPTKDDGPLRMTLEELVTWLTQATYVPPIEPLPTPPFDQRTHVGMAFESSTAAEGMLYTTKGVGLSDALLTKAGGLERRRVEFGLWGEIGVDGEVPDVLHLGGERRLALTSATDTDPRKILRPLSDMLSTNPSMLVMTLLTPADFGGTWRPNPDQMNLPHGLRLKLVSAAARRRVAVSGWDYAANKPKPVRWLAPSGAVYWFQVVSGDPTSLSNHQLEPVSHDAQSRRDGYGLAVWSALPPFS